MKDTPLLHFDNVSFAWKGMDRPLIQNVTWSLHPGDVIHLDAHSGTGKTTFLRLAAGLTPPNKGYITTRTENIGFAFQEPRLLPWLTVLDNLRLAQKKHDDPHALELLRFLQMEEKAMSIASTLSGGEAQRVNLARALVNSPSLLFLDEPFNGLDDALMEKSALLIQKWLGDSNRRGLLIVSHIKKFLTDFNAKSLFFPKFS